MKGISKTAWFNGADKANKELYTTLESAKSVVAQLNIPKDKVILCPWSSDKSNVVKAFKENGYKVISLTNDADIDKHEWDYLVDNPPFGSKFYDVIIKYRHKKVFIWVNYLGIRTWFNSRNIYNSDIKLLICDRIHETYLTADNRKKNVPTAFVSNWYYKDILKTPIH